MTRLRNVLFSQAFGNVQRACSYADAALMTLLFSNSLVK
jgi:hypothetical protein